MPENQSLTPNLLKHQIPNNLKKLDPITEKQVFDRQDGKCILCKKNAIQYISKMKSTTTGLFVFWGLCGNCVPEKGVEYMKP